MGKVRARLEQKRGRPVSPEEVGVALRKDPRSGVRIHKEWERIGSPEMLSGAVRLDDLIQGGGEPVTEEDWTKPDHRVLEQERGIYLGAVMAELKPHERLVIERYYGLGDGNVRTLEEIGQEIGLTRERIRQIKHKTMGRLEHRAKALDMAFEREGRGV
jgi:RNA polymerase primary sigma factor